MADVAVVATRHCALDEVAINGCKQIQMFLYVINQKQVVLGTARKMDSS